MTTTHFFAYGTLAPENPEAAARGGWTADTVRGRLFDLGPYPALVDCGDPTAGRVEGYVRAVDSAWLDGPLDEYEGVAEGLYLRRRVTTGAGLLAWVYVYGRAVPIGARGPIPRWDGPRGGLVIDGPDASFRFPRTDP